MSYKRARQISILIILLGIFLFFFVLPSFYDKLSNWSETKLHFSLGKFPNIPFKLGLDLKGGVELLYEADFSQVKEEKPAVLMEGLRDVIERRINLFGVREPEIQIIVTKNHYRLSVKLPGIKDPEEAVKEIGKTPYLEFRELKPNSQNEFQPTKLTGKYLKRAEVNFNRLGEPVVSLEFNKEGAQLFEEITKRNVGKPLAIYIDNVLISAPIVRETIKGGKAQIEGKFTIEEAKELARNLNAGALPVPIKLISQRSIGPTLGQISLQKSIKAGLFGFLAIIVFLILIYRLPGILASLALIFYVLLTLSLFKAIPVTLTLSGIGGFLLSIGMAVDANILVFARLREELREGRELSEAIKEGFKRAWPSIRDGNFTTLLIAVILFFIGTSFVKGFATTLILGILASLFSAMVVTRVFLISFLNTPFSKIKRLW